MIDHIGIRVADVEASLVFYLRAFEPIGMREAMRIPDGDAFVVGLSGTDGVPTFWLSQGRAAETRELHLAFRAADRGAVDAVHRATVAAGAGGLHAPPEWPPDPPGYYGVVLAGLYWDHLGGPPPRGDGPLRAPTSRDRPPPP